MSSWGKGSRGGGGQDRGKVDGEGVIGLGWSWQLDPQQDTNNMISVDTCLPQCHMLEGSILLLKYTECQSTQHSPGQITHTAQAVTALAKIVHSIWIVIVIVGNASNPWMLPLRDWG